MPSLGPFLVSYLLMTVIADTGAGFPSCLPAVVVGNGASVGGGATVGSGGVDDLPELLHAAAPRQSTTIITPPASRIAVRTVD